MDKKGTLLSVRKFMDVKIVIEKPMTQKHLSG